MKHAKFNKIAALALLFAFTNTTQASHSAAAAAEDVGVEVAARPVAPVVAPAETGCWAAFMACLGRTAAVVREGARIVDEVVDQTEAASLRFCRFVDGVDSSLATIRAVNPVLNLEPIERHMGALRLARDEIRASRGAVGAIGAIAGALSRGEVREAIPSLITAVGETKGLVDRHAGRNTMEALDEFLNYLRTDGSVRLKEIRGVPSVAPAAVVADAEHGGGAAGAIA